MKLWELVSVCRGRNKEALLSTLSSGMWPSIRHDVERFNELVASQDRTRLDFEMPESLVEEVVARLDYRFSVMDSMLRMTNSASEKHLSAAEVGKKFGYDVIEEVLERGSIRVSSPL